MFALGVINQHNDNADVWVNPTANTAYWLILDAGKTYKPLNTLHRVASYINKPKSAGKWFFAFNAVNSPTNAPPIVGVCLQSVINTADRILNTCMSGEFGLVMYSGNIKYLRESSTLLAVTPAWYLATANTSAGIGGDLGGIGYDAATGIVSAWKFDQYGTGQWVQKSDMTTVAAGTVLVPFSVTGPAAGSYVTYRPDVTPPAGFTLW